MCKDLIFYIDDTTLDLTFEFELNFVEGGGGSYPEYTGTYEVTPKTYNQYLNTNNKLMTDDVTVFEIPYAETSNIYGTTVTIAS